MTGMETRCTHSGDPAAERLLAGALSGISSRITALREAGSIGSVVLGGGYGRGEGGATPAGALYNDLDFFVFSECGRAERRQVDEALRPIGEAWAEKLGIEVDFAPARSLARLRRDAGTLMVQELLAGHRVIFGPENALESIPRIPWRELSWTEGARLLFNRGTGLLLAEREADRGESADPDFVRRNLFKAALGCGDALLLAARDYRRTGTERLQALSTRPEAADSVGFYREALEAKYRPRPEAAMPTAERRRQFRELWFDTLARFASEVAGSSSRDPVRNARLLCSAPGGRPEMLRSTLLSLRYAHKLSAETMPLGVHPRLKLLVRLAGLLKKPDPAGEAAYLELWKRFN